MKTEAEIIALSEIKLKAAELLLDNGFYDDAYYLGGYSVELLLKARICKVLCIPDFFVFDGKKLKQEAYKPFKVHDYEQLLVLSGLYQSHSELKAKDQNFASDWSIICNWSEDLRYRSGQKQKDAISFINSIKNVSSWLIQQI